MAPVSSVHTIPHPCLAPGLWVEGVSLLQSSSLDAHATDTSQHFFLKINYFIFKSIITSLLHPFPPSKLIHITPPYSLIHGLFIHNLFLYMCIYCTHMYICVHMCACIMCVHICVYIGMSICICVCVLKHKHTCSVYIPEDPVSFLISLSILTSHGT